MYPFTSHPFIYIKTNQLTVPRARDNHHRQRQHDHLGTAILFAILEGHPERIADVGQIKEIGQERFFRRGSFHVGRWPRRRRRITHPEHTVDKGAQLHGQRCRVDAVETDVPANESQTRCC